MSNAATGRRWKLCISLVAFGAAVLIVGIIIALAEAILAGCALVLFFGAIAAGARRAKVGTESLQADADFSAPPPPAKTQHIYLPRGWTKREK